MSTNFKSRLKCTSNFEEVSKVLEAEMPFSQYVSIPEEFVKWC